MALEPRIARLKSQLAITGLQKKDNALFQVITELIKTVSELDALIASLSTSGGGIASVGEWSVLTNGDATTPELIFADGDVIMTFVP